jgi:hypothetical protein
LSICERRGWIGEVAVCLDGWVDRQDVWLFVIGLFIDRDRPTGQSWISMHACMHVYRQIFLHSQRSISRQDMLEVVPSVSLLLIYLLGFNPSL